MITKFSHRPSVTGLAALASIVVIVAMVAIECLQPARSEDTPANTSGFSPYVANDGAISLPKDYRESFVHLGTWAVAKDKDKPVFEMHNVYTKPEAIQAYRRDGKFPDGAVLVKEITDADAAKLTTGESSWSTDTKVWFVMIKDSKGRFPGNHLWGDGWGWALFKADDPKKNVATDFKTDCITCHIPAKQDDWIYTRGYPILKKTAAAPQ